MAYGTIKVDNITFTNAGSDQTITVSGLFASTSGNLTVTGTVSGNTIKGQTISGVTVTGTTANFTSGNFTNISGGTYTITSGVFAAGSAAAPSISFASYPNTGLYRPGADQIAIATSGTGRLFVDANGNIAIGTSATSNFGSTARSFDINSAGGVANLYVKTGTVGGGLMADAGNGYIQVWTATSHPIAFNIAFSEKMRLDTSGRLGLGATTAPGSIDAKMWIDQSSTSDYGLEINSSGGVKRPGLWFRDASGALAGRIVGQAGLELATTASATPAVTIDASQRVGIGTSSPGKTLDVSGDARFYSDSSNVDVSINRQGNGIYNPALTIWSAYSLTVPSFRFTIDTNGTAIQYLNKLRFMDTYASNTERARIDGSGRLLVGTSTSRNARIAYGPSGGSLSSDPFPIQNESGSVAGASFITNRNADPSGSYVVLGRSRGPSPGGTDIVNAGDNLGSISFNGADGTNLEIAATIRCDVDGTPGTGDMPGRLVFSTTSDGASSPTERMRIDSSGKLLVGTSTSTMSGATVQQNGLHGVVTNTALLALNGTLDITIASGGVSFTGFLIVENTYAPSASTRTQTLYAVMGRGTTATFTSLATTNGSVSAAPFTLTVPSAGVIRFTNTTTGGGSSNCNLVWMGPAGY
jgi:hypothetical protein